MNEQMVGKNIIHPLDLNDHNYTLLPFGDSDKNILKPGSGEPIITHTQELIFGIYYLTNDDNT